MAVVNAKKGHPRGLYVLFMTEMWERFSYYGMRAMFVLYMVKCLMLSKEDASQIYGSYTGLVYLTPLLGGYLADRFWGNRRSIVLGSVVMAAGQFLMFVSACMYTRPSAHLIMLVGLGLLILGNGFFQAQYFVDGRRSLCERRQPPRFGLYDILHGRERWRDDCAALVRIGQLQ